MSDAYIGLVVLALRIGVLAALFLFVVQAFRTMRAEVASGVPARGVVRGGPPPLGGGGHGHGGGGRPPGLNAPFLARGVPRLFWLPAVVLLAGVLSVAIGLREQVPGPEAVMLVAMAAV